MSAGRFSTGIDTCVSCRRRHRRNAGGKVIGLRQSGMTYDAIATQVGLIRTGVFNICRHYRQRGRVGLKSGRKGPAPGYSRLLSVEQERGVRKLIRHHMPVCAVPGYGAGAGPGPLRRAPRGAHDWYLSEALGYTAQKPLRQAYEQNPAAVQRWLRQDYPAIVAQAKATGGIIFWADETGLRSHDLRGRGYAPRGRTPVIRVNHKRAGVGLISAVSNKGEPCWMMLDGAIKTAMLIGFLTRLVRDAGCKVFLIRPPGCAPLRQGQGVAGWTRG